MAKDPSRDNLAVLVSDTGLLSATICFVSYGGRDRRGARGSQGVVVVVIQGVRSSPILVSRLSTSLKTTTLAFRSREIRNRHANAHLA